MIVKLNNKINKAKIINQNILIGKEAKKRIMNLCKFKEG